MDANMKQNWTIKIVRNKQIIAEKTGFASLKNVQRPWPRAMGIQPGDTAEIYWDGRLYCYHVWGDERPNKRGIPASIQNISIYSKWIYPPKFFAKN